MYVCKHVYTQIKEPSEQMRLGRDDNSFAALFYDTSEVEESQAEEAPHPPCLNHRKSAFKVADPRLRTRILDSTIHPSAMQVFLSNHPVR